MRTDRKDREGNVYDFQWDSKREGFVVTVNSKPVKDLFYKAKGIFDRSGAQEQAQKMMIKLVSDAIQVHDDAKQYEYQYVKPLSDLEKEFVELEKKFYKKQLDQKGIDRWLDLGKSGIIRKSLIDQTHPAVKRESKEKK
jgi:hypothetical protein